MKAALFDLDDTLYPEIEFVDGGFRAVSRFLAERYGADPEAVYRQMEARLTAGGRGRIFDDVLQELGLYSQQRVQASLLTYRSHRPRLHPFDDAVAALTRLRSAGFRLGIVTDGLASVQRNKLAALALADRFDAVICTDELGRDCGKPSPVPFRVALEMLDVPPEKSAYVADDPRKDFAGPNGLGMLSVQLCRAGQQLAAGHAPPSEAHAPQVVVESLSKVVELLTGSETWTHR